MPLTPRSPENLLKELDLFFFSNLPSISSQKVGVGAEVDKASVDQGMDSLVFLLNYTFVCVSSVVSIAVWILYAVSSMSLHSSAQRITFKPEGSIYCTTAGNQLLASYRLSKGTNALEKDC
jgi:hypothetical protein